MTEEERWKQLLFGVLAGNIFDWGAKAVSELLEAGTLDFQMALNKLKGSDYFVRSTVLLCSVSIYSMFYRFNNCDSGSDLFL